MKDFILARCNKKLLIFRTTEEAAHAYKIYPEADLIPESDASVVELHRALNNLLHGEDGYSYLLREFGSKSPKEIYRAYQ